MSVEMTHEVEFRDLLSDDERALFGLFVRNAVPDVTRHFHPFPLSEETARKLCSDHVRDRYYVCATLAQIVALSMLRGWEEGYVVPSFGILVDRDWHGRGIGSRLTDFTIREARRLECLQVRLSVYSSNSRAHQMYVRRGFVERSRATVSTEQGRDERIVMVKQLES